MMFNWAQNQTTMSSVFMQTMTLEIVCYQEPPEWNGIRWIGILLDGAEEIEIIRGYCMAIPSEKRHPSRSLFTCIYWCIRMGSISWQVQRNDWNTTNTEVLFISVNVTKESMRTFNQVRRVLWMRTIPSLCTLAVTDEFLEITSGSWRKTVWRTYVAPVDQPGKKNWAMRKPLWHGRNLRRNEIQCLSAFPGQHSSWADSKVN